MATSRMTIPLRAHSATHVGLHHLRNEDAHAVMTTDEGGMLLVVCDGMGGMGRGDEASQLAIEVLGSTMEGEEGLPPDRMRAALRAADNRIRDELCEAVEQPGATAVMVYVLEGIAHVAWVGDSRAYLVRGGQVLHRTRDHKLVEELVEAGQLTPEQARDSALAHVVTRALGGRSASEPPVHPATLGFPWRLQQGDQIVLCSDGVCDLMEDQELSTLIANATPAEGTARLVETALLRGGHDNITAIVAVWEGPSWHDEEGATPIIQHGRDVAPARDHFRDTPSDGRVTDEIDLNELEAMARRSRPPSDSGDPDDMSFADQPTAEVDGSALRIAEAARAAAGPLPHDPQGAIWLGLGATLVLLGLVSAAFALAG